MARGKRTKKRAQKSVKNATLSRAQRDRRALESLAQKRRAFEPLLAQIVAGVLHAQGPRSGDSTGESAATGWRDQTWVEVGSGLGQLRSLLPPEVLDSITHTELSKSLANALAERCPEARVLAADVTRLPFESQSVDAVLGLCVFDSFSLPTEACRELGRVLRPGGRFIHFLDAATNVEPVLVELVGKGRLPLPNFLADTALLEPALLDMKDLGHLVGPYHDLLSVPLAQFEVVMAMLSRAQHPMANLLKKYSAPFLERPFDSLAAARAFVALTSDIKSSRPMNQALTSLVSTLRQPPYSQHIPFSLVAHSSLSHFKARLEKHFDSDTGFVSRLSTVVYARSFEPNRDQALRAHVRRVGIVQNLVDWPPPVGTSVQRLNTERPGPEPEDSQHPEATSRSHVLREAAVYCFVSEKIS